MPTCNDFEMMQAKKGFKGALLEISDASVEEGNVIFVKYLPYLPLNGLVTAAEYYIIKLLKTGLAAEG